jgi:hypothetical protein
MMGVVDHRWPRSLGDEAAVTDWLAALDPRDCVFFVYEVTDPAIAAGPLAAASPAARLLAGIAAGRVLQDAVASSWDSDPDAPALTRYLGDRFPPETAVPVLGQRWLPVLRDIARGRPGDQVTHGLFPSTPSKLARLALARAGDYPADVVRSAALTGYGEDRPYHAHDALACALVHPSLDAAALVAELTAIAASHRRGWRSRRKTHRILIWARDAGYLAP